MGIVTHTLIIRHFSATLKVAERARILSRGNAVEMLVVSKTQVHNAAPVPQRPAGFLTQRIKSNKIKWLKKWRRERDLKDGPSEVSDT
jgi:hypothetical protein